MDIFTSDHPDDGLGDPPVPEPGRTPPPARAPDTPERLDLGDWEPPTTRAAPRRWLLVAAMVPWLVVLAILLTGRPGPSAPPSAPTATTSPSATPTSGPSDASTADDAGGATAPASPQVLALGGPGAPTSRGQAMGVAVAVARSWLSTRPPGPPVEGLEPAPGADSRYVEHVAVESVDHPARGAAVVTVRVIVLPVDGDAYGPAEQLRLGVPVALDAEGARPAGTPWRLPIAELGLSTPDGQPVEDVDLQLAAAEAVTAAGYRDVALESLERTSGWVWRASVSARAPGEAESRPHVVWLRSDVGRLVVAGGPPPAPTPSTTPTAEPSEPAPTDPEDTP